MKAKPVDLALCNPSVAKLRGQVYSFKSIYAVPIWRGDSG